jgi:hypothetical protein
MKIPATSIGKLGAALWGVMMTFSRVHNGLVEGNGSIW